ncbi:unnamed protein product [Nezara viridula]|uniref:Uncharacterized protein n=1 Tax=Nezara viridula TaxID=85310 RepID=A0A9P0MTK2_NEZVI|nr:unnamed protein product [Nezara viridula]
MEVVNPKKVLNQQETDVESETDQVESSCSKQAKSLENYLYHLACLDPPHFPLLREDSGVDLTPWSTPCRCLQLWYVRNWQEKEDDKVAPNSTNQISFISLPWRSRLSLIVTVVVGRNPSAVGPNQLETVGTTFQYSNSNKN